jgi:hypothetical protein
MIATQEEYEEFAKWFAGVDSWLREIRKDKEVLETWFPGLSPYEVPASIYDTRRAAADYLAGTVGVLTPVLHLHHRDWLEWIYIPLEYVEKREEIIADVAMFDAKAAELLDEYYQQEINLVRQLIAQGKIPDLSAHDRSCLTNTRLLQAIDDDIGQRSLAKRMCRATRDLFEFARRRAWCIGRYLP